MRNRILFLLCFLCIGLQAFAQISISGKVVDAGGKHLFSAHPQQGAAQQETGVCPQEGQIRECCRQWFLTEGDVDDFIFYGSQPRVSER